MKTKNNSKGLDIDELFGVGGLVFSQKNTKFLENRHPTAHCPVSIYVCHVPSMG